MARSLTCGYRQTPPALNNVLERGPKLAMLCEIFHLALVAGLPTVIGNTFATLSICNMIGKQISSFYMSSPSYTPRSDANVMGKAACPPQMVEISPR